MQTPDYDFINANDVGTIYHFELNDLVTFKRKIIKLPNNLDPYFINLDDTNDTQNYELFSDYIGVVIAVEKSQLQSPDLDRVRVFWLVVCKNTDNPRYTVDKNGYTKLIEQFEITVHNARILSHLYVEEEARRKSMQPVHC